MRFRIRFISPDKTIFLPFNYHEHVQAMIYKMLPSEKSQVLHDVGFRYEKRSFKLFTFSRIQGKLIKNISGEGLIFSSPITLQIASPVDWIMQELAEGILRSEKIRLGKSWLFPESIEVFQKPFIAPPLKIRMLSPMTVYSTLEKPDGKKLTHYYTPHEDDFSRLISENLRKKAEILYQKETGGTVKLTAISRRNRERIIKYKGFVIKAWDGDYLLEGDPDLIRVSYDAGLGSKNSQGFGMWEIKN